MKWGVGIGGEFEGGIFVGELDELGKVGGEFGGVSGNLWGI